MDLSNYVPVRGRLFKLEIAPAPLSGDSGKVCMFVLDLERDRLLISDDVPLRYRPICAALATVMAFDHVGADFCREGTR